MGCCDDLKTLLSPLGLYDLTAGRRNEAELFALGAALDGVGAALEAAEREALVPTATGEGLAFREELPVSEDFEFMMRCIPAASRVQGIDAPLYRYRMRAESLSHTLSWKKLKNNLQVKAAVYRKYPTGATANYFADSALMISLLFDGREEAEQFVQDNRDIISQVTQSSLKVYRCMLALLGPIKASWLYLHLKKGLRRD